MLSNVFVYGDAAVIESIEEFVRQEDYARYRQPRLNKNILTETWTRVKQIKRKVGKRKKYEIFDQEYEIVTEKPEVNLDIGEYRKTKGSEDSKLLKKIQVSVKKQRDNHIHTWLQKEKRNIHKSKYSYRRTEDSL